MQRYELEYWEKSKIDYHERMKTALNLFPQIYLGTFDNKVVADVGCGPKCGIFQIIKSKTMYAIDPLWDKYDDGNLSDNIKNVIKVKAFADNFKIPRLTDFIFSINSLDHSGSLSESIENIFYNLIYEGIFCLHIHMRNKNQLNTGHRMVVTEEIILSHLNRFGKVVYKKTFDECPLDKKKYKTFVAIVKKVL